MKPALRLLSSAALLLAVGCTTLFPRAPSVGETESEVIAKWGNPTNVFRDGPVRVLEYPRSPYNQHTYMARIGPDGRLQSFEQVLTDEKFATVQIGKTTRDEILRTFGTPYETSYLPLKDYEVWSYAFQKHGLWNVLMHIHFDRSGVVQLMLHGPDQRFEEVRPRTLP